MAQKIYDIMPPKEEPKETIINVDNNKLKEKNSGFLPVKVLREPEIISREIADKEFVKNENLPNIDMPAKPKPVLKKINFSFKKIAIISGGVLAVVVLGFLYFNLQKAKIEIWPKTELLSYNAKITADKSITEVDFENKKIPAELFEIEKDLWQDFPATGNGQNSGKASGMIKIYNKLNPVSAFTLKTGTHFLSDSGKYFVTLEKVTIPAGTLKGGKITPGSISVKVVAEEAGKDFNIGASKFSIPKLVGTNYYYVIYAESENSMTGGFLSDVKNVTDLDLSNAKKELSDKVLSEAEASLRQKIPSDYVVFDDAVSKKVIETFSPIKIGAVADNFSYQVKVKVEALVFKRQDIEKFAKYDQTGELVVENSIVDQSYKIDFIPYSIDINSGKMILNSDFSVKVYQPIDTDDLTQLLMQKKKTEVKDLIFSRLPNQVERLDVTFWPFWTKKVPTNKDKINIELKFE